MREAPVVGLAAVILAALIGQIALAGGGGTGGGSQATISISKKKLKKLIKNEVAKQVAKATGPQGPKGDPGASATSLWANVNGSGALLKSSGGVSSVQQDTGIYTVSFNRNIASCGYLATVGYDEALSLPGFIVTSSQTPGSVFVGTRNAAGAAANLPFFLGVFC